MSPAVIVPSAVAARLRELAHNAMKGESQEMRQFSATLLILEVQRLLEPRALGAAEVPR